jgi:hypothetical protein
MNGKHELDEQAHLLQRLKLDLEVIIKIKIHPGFLSQSSESSGSRSAACAKTHSMSPLNRPFTIWLLKVRPR